MSTGVDEIPILKKLTSLEPEMELIPPPPPSPMRRQIAVGADSPVLELSDSDSGAEADIDSESDSDIDTESGNDEEAPILNRPVGLELPAWLWLATLALMIAYLWGIAYATTPVRDLSQRRM